MQRVTGPPSPVTVYFDPGVIGRSIDTPPSASRHTEASRLRGGRASGAARPPEPPGLRSRQASGAARPPEPPGLWSRQASGAARPLEPPGLRSRQACGVARRSAGVSCTTHELKTTPAGPSLLSHAIVSRPSLGLRRLTAVEATSRIRER
ncbi:hypothetical protein NHX12_008136 [Muraenolepis orangiensis]|uniref:Uncharacterized protein n=1 Tax=Muraenolepis orangiensis TaxID=630683 RepID=A0A9Q0DKX5_9TELE|nr:hypothetical protein NHX12_008136 [Muraenolepis orangiensis]